MQISYELLIIFIKGMAVGFVGALPLGPLGIICIRRVLQAGFFAGVIGGLGTALADAVFGVISAFGLTVIAQLIKEMELPLRIIGGVFLLGMGFHVLTHKPKETLQEIASASSISHMGSIVSNFFITLTNPLALVFFTLAFASLGIGENQSLLKGVFVVAGVSCGSMASWVILSAAVTMKRNSKILSDMTWINRVSGGALILCGIWALAILVTKL